MAKKTSARDVIIEKAYELVMKQGFSATSVDNILDVSGLTKGAFFYHFKAKSDLGLALARRYVERDNNIFHQILLEAEQKTDDPLDRMLVFLDTLADHMAAQHEVPSCLFASFCYDTHTEEVSQYMQEQVARWQSHYVRLFRPITQIYAPRYPVTEEELADQFMCVIEGGYVLSRVYQDPEKVARSIRVFRQYFAIIFKGTAEN